MPFSQNDIRTLAPIAGSEEPMNPRAFQVELGLQRVTISWLITHLVENGLVERRGSEVILAGWKTNSARLYL